MSTTAAPAFADLTRRQQLAAVRVAATAALGQFGIETASLRLVNHDFNTTFRVHTDDGEDAALRINLNSAYGVKAVQAEAEKVALLGRKGVCQAPSPHQTLAGGFAAAAPLLRLRSTTARRLVLVASGSRYR